MSMASDVELLVRWSRGEAEAGKALTLRHFVAVRAYFLTKAPHDHAALVKEVFARMVAQRGSYSSRTSFRVYVFGIARALLVEYLRRLGGDTAADPMGSSATVLDAGRPAPELAEGTHFRELFDALRKLALRDQDLLELHYLQGLTVVEIVTLLKVPEATVHAQLRDALGRLVERYRERVGKAAPSTLGPDEVARWLVDARAGLANLRMTPAAAG